jgi:hypothetical protein
MPQGIILVGGLGSSPYLHEYLKGIHSANRIDILQSGGIRPYVSGIVRDTSEHCANERKPSRTAICRGAVYKGFLDGLDKFHRGDGIEAPISITSAISRASYGIGYYEMFDSSKHSAIQKTWSENEKNWIADGKMRWYLKKVTQISFVFLLCIDPRSSRRLTVNRAQGENVSKKDPIKYNFYYLYSEDPGSKFMVNMRQCEDDVPPSQAGPTVADSCTITWTMLTPFALLPDYTNSAGEILKKLEFDLEMIPSGASIEFAVFIDGKRQGGSNTSVRF